MSEKTRKWRNWQTRRLQVPVVAISCGFKSHLPHKRDESSSLSFFYLKKEKNLKKKKKVLTNREKFCIV